MDIKERSSVVSFRSSYEKSGLTKAAFAKQEGLEYWKAVYALRKGLELKKKSTKPSIGFKKLRTISNSENIPIKEAESISNKLIIRTSYGSVIEIPL